MVFISCQKEILAPVTTVQKSFSDSAIQYLKAKLSDADFYNLDVNSFQVLRLKNKNIGIKIFEKGMSPDNFILLKKDAENFTGNRVSISGIKSKEHDGNILLEALDKTSNTKFIVENNKVVRIITNDNTGSKISIPKNYSNSISQKTETYVLPEVVIVVYRQAVEIDFGSLFWLFNQAAAYDSYYFYLDNAAGGGGGGGGGGSNTSNDNVAAAPKTYSPDSPVSDVKNEVKCFTNNSSSSYAITVNINQPVPGSREIFEPLANFPVGHTYLTLQQNNADGSSIIRNIGFYPKNIVKPGSSTDVATFGEDSNTPFDVSLRISVSGSDFNTVVNNLVGQQRLMYDLDNFNCANSAIGALQSININLPDTKSNNVLFSGSNPADLGEDIKNLNLDKFSADNGGRKVVRTQSSDNSQKPPAKKGGC